jgi:hypothetical protein
MDSSNLAKWQLRKISNQIAGQIGYLHRLKQRMEKCGFPADDELLLAAIEAHRAADELQRLIWRKIDPKLAVEGDVDLKTLLNKRPPDWRERKRQRDQRRNS